ncbi:hypothetical protein HYQ46_000503 [Verticillium longisporum]|nr:hypothetical protein HYQ46_000503 [Verticillium longisporum]
MPRTLVPNCFLVRYRDDGELEAALPAGAFTSVVDRRTRPPGVLDRLMMDNGFGVLEADDAGEWKAYVIKRANAR